MRRFLLALFLLALTLVAWRLGKPAPRPDDGAKKTPPSPASSTPGVQKGSGSDLISSQEMSVIEAGADSDASTAELIKPKSPPRTGDPAKLPAPSPFSAAQIAALLSLEPHLQAGDGTVDAALRPLRAWAHRDPAACGAWIAENLTGLTRMRCLEELMGLWSTQDIPRALDWLNANVSKEGHSGPYATVLSAWAESDPAAAAAWLHAHPEAGAAAGNYEAILAHWVTIDAAAAATWARANIQAGTYAALLPSLLLARAPGSDPAVFLEGLLPTIRDSSLSTAIRATPQGQELQALELAHLITDPTAAARARDSILQRWSTTDRQAVEAYTLEHNLPLPLTATAPLKPQPVEAPAADQTPPALPVESSRAPNKKGE